MCSTSSLSFLWYSVYVWTVKASSGLHSYSLLWGVCTEPYAYAYPFMHRISLWFDFWPSRYFGGGSNLLQEYMLPFSLSTRNIGQEYSPFCGRSF